MVSCCVHPVFLGVGVDLVFLVSTLFCICALGGHKLCWKQSAQKEFEIRSYYTASLSELRNSFGKEFGSLLSLQIAFLGKAYLQITRGREILTSVSWCCSAMGMGRQFVTCFFIVLFPESCGIWFLPILGFGG